MTKTWNPIISETELLQPLKRKKETTYILNDFFSAETEFWQIDKVMAVVALCPQHTFQIATKNAKRMKEYFEQFRTTKEEWDDAKNNPEKKWLIMFCEENDKSTEYLRLLSENIVEIASQITYNAPFYIKGWRDMGWQENGFWAKMWTKIDDDFSDFDFPLKNLWLGVKIENQEQADSQIPLLFEIPAAVRFVLCEPLLSYITLTRLEVSHTTPFLNALEKIDWVVVGGANNKNAQPTHPDWVRSIRNQCEKANVPFLFKGWGYWIATSQMTDELHSNINDYGCGIGTGCEDIPLGIRRNKKECLLDGEEYKEFPN